MQPQQPHPAHGYPQQPYGPPPPRRRTGLIAAIVAGCLVLAGVAVALVIVFSDKESDGSSSGDSGNAAASGGSSGKRPNSPATKPVQAPPRACDLLAPPQLAAIVPGKLKEPFGQEPEPGGQGIITSMCIWSNETVVSGQRFPAVRVLTRVTATSAEDLARTTFQSSVQCGTPASTRIQIAGADEACLEHTSFDTKTKAPVGGAKVAARCGTVVVEFNYNNAEMPIEAIDNAASSGTTAVLAAIPQSR